MKKTLNLVSALFLSMILHAGDAVISFSLDLSPVNAVGIFIDSTVLILSGGENDSSQQVVIMGNKAYHIFDSLEAGTYSLRVKLYQQDYILAENISKGYITANETRDVEGNVLIACAIPILYLNWNPDLQVTGDDFFDYSIDPDSNFLKRYPLPHLDSLAQAFRDSGMHYYQEYAVHWGILDTNLIPIVEYPWGFYRNPVTTSHTAFAFYDEYIRNGDSLSYVGFINNVNWLMENMDSNYYLHYDFKYRHYRDSLPEGWISGMAQGLALCAISLAYYETGEQKYMDGATGIFGTLNRNTTEYFSIAVDEQDYYWIEEYPHDDFCHVLNGYIAALWGIWCYYTISGEDFAGVLLEAGIKTISDNYPDWNYIYGNLSYYCLHLIVRPDYHDKHLVQLRTYGEYFSVPEFFTAANCFENNYFAAYPRSINFPSDSSSIRPTIFSSFDWSVETDTGWLSVNQHGDTLEIKCQDNPSSENRTAKIFFTGADSNTMQTIMVTQERGIHLIIDSINVPADAGMINYGIRPDSGWIITSRSAWIETLNENDSLFILKYEANPNIESRTGFVETQNMDSTLLYHIRVHQDPKPLYLKVDPAVVYVEADSSFISIAVDAPVIWSANSLVDWLLPLPYNDSIMYVIYHTNERYHMRQGTIIISLNDTLQKEIHFYQHASTVGINPEQGKEVLEIFPNPARSKVHIRNVSSETGPLAIDIFNLSGEKVLNKIILSPGIQVELDINKLGIGIYFIKVTGSQKNFVRKLIVQ